MGDRRAAATPGPCAPQNGHHDPLREDVHRSTAQRRRTRPRQFSFCRPSLLRFADPGKHCHSQCPTTYPVIQLTIFSTFENLCRQPAPTSLTPAGWRREGPGPRDGRVEARRCLEPRHAEGEKRHAKERIDRRRRHGKKFVTAPPSWTVYTAVVRAHWS